MSALPPNTAQLAPIIQMTRGIVAMVGGKGLYYSVYRLSSASNVSIVSGDPVIASIPAQLGKARKVDLENQTFDLEAYEVVCDNRSLVLNDLLVGLNQNDLSQYTFAQYREGGPTICVRTELTATITRPDSAGGSDEDQPSSGAVVAPGYIGEESNVTNSTERPLTLSAGRYSFVDPPDGGGTTSVQITPGEQTIPVTGLDNIQTGDSVVIDTGANQETVVLTTVITPSGSAQATITATFAKQHATGTDFLVAPVTPAQVPCGIQPLNRVRDAREPKIPTALNRDHFLGYIPILPGQSLKREDRVYVPNGNGQTDKYEIALVYQNAVAGLIGNICVFEFLETF